MPGKMRAVLPSTDSVHFSDVSAASSPAAEHHRRYFPRPRSLLERMIDSVSMSTTRRRRRQDQKTELGYFSVSQDESADGSLRKYSPAREEGRGQRTSVFKVIKKVLLVLPVVVLVVFGTLHLLQVSIGGAHLLWDLNVDDRFLPDWGVPGHLGEGLVEYPTDATRDVIPINCHSHNDYVRRVPLLDAIHWGCTGVEADVWKFNEELFVGHSTASLTKNRTFRSLYIDPLVELIDKMNQGTDFANATTNTTRRGIFEENPDQTLVLLVDFKTSGIDTFPVVHKQLSALREKGYLSFWDGEEFHSRPVTVVGTGNTPFNLVVAEKQHRDIFFDAPLDKMWEPPAGLEGSVLKQLQAASLSSNQNSNQGSTGTADATIDDFNSTSSYYASVSFMHSVGFVWRGRLSAKQMGIIRGQIKGAHRRGLKVRYWDTPSWPINLRNYIWSVLVEEGADMLNVDDLRGAASENWKLRTHRLWR